MPDRLREFVYLDDVSVNSHLSSLSKALPREVIDSEQSGKETEGGVDVKVVKGGKGWTKSTGTETTRDATSPYRFEELRETLVDEDIPIHDNPDPQNVSRGDVIRVDGVAKPMSLYRIELAVTSLLETFDAMSDEDFINDLSDLSDVDVSDTDMPQAIAGLQTLLKFVETLIGDRIPLRIIDEDNGGEYVTALDRPLMRVSDRRAFFDENRYVVFGRVRKMIEQGEEWDPVEATRVTSRYFTEEDDMTESLRNEIRSVSDELDMEMTEDDLRTTGQSVEISPIAVYW